MKPTIIIEPGAINSTGIKALRDNGINVVTAKGRVQFLDVPAISSRTQIDEALLELAKNCLGSLLSYQCERDKVAGQFAKILLQKHTAETKTKFT